MPSITRACASLHRKLFAFARDKNGLAAVEFAMLLPLMVTLYLGGVEVSQAVAIDRKVSLTARTIADLVSQGRVISDAEMITILGAAQTVSSPYANANLKVVVTSVKIDGNGNATVEWSRPTPNATGLTTGAAVTVPDALKVANTYVILATATYAYTPSIGYVITGTLTLKDELFMRPRFQDRVCLNACT